MTANKKIYICSILAFLHSAVHHNVAICDAENKDHAYGFIMRKSREVFYPQSEGYYNHSVTLKSIKELENTYISAGGKEFKEFLR